jgi:hypothetical protein
LTNAACEVKNKLLFREERWIGVEAWVGNRSIKSVWIRTYFDESIFALDRKRVGEIENVMRIVGKEGE